MTTSTDLYRSRVSGEPEMMIRVDPVLWGNAETSPGGPLTAEQLMEFNDRGFLWLNGVLTDSEVRALAAEVDRVRSHQEDQEADSSVAPSPSAGTSIFNIHRHSESLRNLVRDDRLAGAARQITGSDIYVHQARVDLKPALQGRSAFWHSDFETWHMEDGMPRARALTVLIPLTESTEFNGSLLVIPRSHRTFVACPGDSATQGSSESPPTRSEWDGRVSAAPVESSIRALSDENGILLETGPAGSVLLLDCNLMYASAGNMSPHPRADVAVVYNSVHNTLAEPFSGATRRADHIASRDFTPVGDL